MFDILTENLNSLGYKTHTFQTKEEAKDFLLAQIKGKTIGIGGSITVKELDVYKELSENNTVFWHWEVPNEMSNQTLKAARNAEVYISSVNAIAESGEIVNIDGTCNRVASISYGHDKVYLIIGKNKITDDLDSAIYRARNVAAPLNARRLGKNTPCAFGELKCHNCKSPEKICKNLSLLYKKPGACEYEVILINEELGY